MWESVHRCTITRHIRRLDINPPNEEEQYLKRVQVILSRTSSLHTLHIVIDGKLSLDYRVRFLQTCITELQHSKSKAHFSIAVPHSILGTSLGHLLLELKDKFSLTRLNVESEGIYDNSLLEFLSQFQDLQFLEFWNFSSSDNSDHDMNQFLKNLPLQGLTLHQIVQVASFPHQLKKLQIGSDASSILNNCIWIATCNLKNLSELVIDCNDIEKQDEEPFIFKSSNLRTLSGNLIAKTEEILTHQIIQPILNSCHHLTSIKIYINSPVSINLLTLLLSKESLMEVGIWSAASPYTFQEFSVLPGTLPNLRSLKLPWPASIDIAINDNEETTTDRGYNRNHRGDVLDRLTFDQCQRLAAKFPRLNKIVFEINTEAFSDLYLSWNESLTPDVPFDRSQHDQSFKIATFTREESSCLNLCSVFRYSFNDRNLINDPETSMVLSLYLNQIRRHGKKR